MVPVLVLTHGNLADELLTAARKIDPHLAEGSSAMSLPWDVDYDQATRQLKHELKSADQGTGVLILTDMFGGTPSNISYSFLEEGRVEVLSGVNLPVLVQALDHRGKLPISELAASLETFGRKSITLASSILKGNKRS